MLSLRLLWHIYTPLCGVEYSENLFDPTVEITIGFWYICRCTLLRRLSLHRNILGADQPSLGRMA
jgi:hypothetical protein